jgi:hypothetical protein
MPLYPQKLAITAPSSAYARKQATVEHAPK